jgi:predicted HAD superfamily phosphohydrolase YqeG
MLAERLEHPGYFCPDVFAIPYPQLVCELDLLAIQFDLDINLLPHGGEDYSLATRLLLLKLSLEVREVWLNSNNPVDRNHLAITDNMYFFNSNGLVDLALGRGKPNPEFFLRTCRERQIPPWRVLTIGDNFIRDAVGALLAGQHAITTDRLHPDPVYDKFPFMTRYFESLALREFGIGSNDGVKCHVPEQYRLHLGQPIPRLEGGDASCLQSLLLV